MNHFKDFVLASLTVLVAAGAQSKTILMTKAGTSTYHGSVHGKTMHGQIVVTP